jgi:hypothetical protein
MLSQRTTSGIFIIFFFNSDIRLLTHLQRLPRIVRDGVEKQPWAGYRKRVMMSLLYALSFLFLLRIDAALKLEFRHFRLVDKKKGRLEVTLDFWKTAQDRGTMNLDLDYL